VSAHPLTPLAEGEAEAHRGYNFGATQHDDSPSLGSATMAPIYVVTDLKQVAKNINRVSLLHSQKVPLGKRPCYHPLNFALQERYSVGPARI
jgi:hypothetical protein